MSFAVAGRRAAVATVLLVAVTSACADEPVVHTQDAEAEEVELESGRIGHVQVVVQPRQDQDGPEVPAVRVEARFAEFRGLDETGARRRANIPHDPAAGITVGECVPTHRFSELGNEAEIDRELTLVDGGDLRVAIGALDVFVPLALVPDLVPWVSGVEYVHVAEDTASINSAPDGMVPVSIHVDGSPDDGLGEIDVSLNLPPQFELLPALETATAEDAGALVLRWQPPGESTDIMILQLAAHGEVSVVGEDVTCVVWDAGEARLDMQTLRDNGLGDADLIRVTARRLRRTQVDADAFESIEVMVELRDQLIVPRP